MRRPTKSTRITDRGLDSAPAGPLILSTETLHTLQDADLTRVVGGGTLRKTLSR